MELSVEWVDQIDTEDFKSIGQSNVLQHEVYSQAVLKQFGQKTRTGLIRINDQKAGMFRIVEAGFLFNFFHAVMLDRGPLWFDGYGGAVHAKVFFEWYHHAFPPRWGRKRRILPELYDNSTVRAVLKQIGLERKDDTKGYQTLWWDLSLSEQDVRAQLSKGWASALKKAEQSLLTIEWDDKGRFYPWLKKHYVLDKAARGYDGISPQLLDNIAAFSTSDFCTLIGKASLDGNDVAAILVFCHGQSATYQIGWTSQGGRDVCAHHLLLWQARNVLQDRSVRHFDLGGINDDEGAKGIRKFKEGTGADTVRYVGHYN